MRKLFLWNASGSAPRGLYLLRPAKPLRGGELVAVLPPEPLARFVALRGYLPLGTPLLKHIAALGGQTVCRFGDRVAVDDHDAVLARERDTSGRPLPRWQGCRTLRNSQVFLLNPAVPDSFDGRYFGVLSADTVTARAEPLWIISEH
ncbi:MAG: S26 family signal peptidase [Alphaproteobacteria bacterium]|nr:S26 family signal peptidase [Alphaproteobacteria bacterium]MBL6938208.1 S26 family signal peptidase [Alphaproteobacteria bacterium]MBL7097264.1 S26 family signal peptidase [Alphaproteobacteria bacterium]